MITNKCVHCINGYNKMKQKPCSGCRSNPYYSAAISTGLKEHFERGEEECMQIEGEHPWT